MSKSQFHFFQSARMFLNFPYLKEGAEMTQLKKSSTININSHVSGGKDSNYISKLEELMRKIDDDHPCIVCSKYDSKDTLAMFAQYSEEEGLFHLYTFEKKDLNEHGIKRFCS